MTETPRITSVRDEAGKVVLAIAAEGRVVDVPLTVFEVASLVAMLYSARAAALKAPRDDAPEMMSVMHRLTLGSTTEYEILRIYLGPEIFHDFAAPLGSWLATMLAEWRRTAERDTGETPVPFGPQGDKH